MKSKSQKRSEAAERQEAYDALSLEEKKKDAGKKVLAKLNAPRKASTPKTEEEIAASKQAPLTQEQKNAKKKAHKDALAATKAGKSVPPTETNVITEDGPQVPAGWDTVSA